MDELVQILLSIPTNDSAMVFQICDDALGGITSIDPRKFAGEFIARRKDENSRPDLSREIGLLSSSLPLKASTAGGFVVVNGKKKKNKKK